MTSCPVCGIPWPAPLSCCPCGFAPEAIDHFVVQLKLRRSRAVGRQVIGLTSSIVTTFLAWVMAPEFAWALSVPFAGIIALAGLIVFTRATTVVVRSTRHLRAVAELHQLPVARIIK